MNKILNILAVTLILASFGIVALVLKVHSAEPVVVHTFEEAPVGELISHGVNTSMQRTIDGRELQGE